MKRHVGFRLLPAVALAAAVLVLPSLARAAEVLKVVPHDALGLVLIKDVAKFDQTVRDATKRLRLGDISLIELLQARFGLRAGLDDRGSFAIAAMPPRTEGGEPALLVYIPTTDYAELIRPFEPEDSKAELTRVRIDGEPMFVAKRDGFAVFASEKDRATLAAALVATKGIDVVIEPAAEFIDRHELAWIAAPDGVRFAAGQMANQVALLRAVAGDLAEAEAEAFKGVLKAYEELLRGVQRDVTHFVLGAHAKESGDIHVASLAVIRPDAELSTRLDAIEPVDQPLGGLPGGPFAMALGGPVPKPLAEQLVRTFGGIGGLDREPLPEDARKRIMDRSIELLRPVRSLALALRAEDPSQPVYANLHVSMHVDDAPAWIDQYEAALKEISEIRRDSDSPAFDMKIARVDVDGTEALQVTAKLPEGAVPEELARRLFGDPRTITGYIAAADKQTIVGAYISKESLAASLKAVREPKSSLAADEHISATRDKLIADPHWVFYCSPRGGLSFLWQAVERRRADAGAPAAEPPRLRETPPVGLAIKTDKSGVESDMVVPVEVLEAIGEAIEQSQR